MDVKTLAKKQSSWYKISLSRDLEGLREIEVEFYNRGRAAETAGDNKSILIL